jgi:hypothetical protein
MNGPVERSTQPALRLVEHPRYVEGQGEGRISK